MSSIKAGTYFVVLTITIVALLSLNLSVGTIAIPIRSLWNILIQSSTEEPLIWKNIIWKTRFPQTITAMVAGAALGVSGLQMQTLFRNSLAGPSELGVSSGASLGVAFVVLLSGNIGGFVLSKMGFVGEMTVSMFAIAGSLSVMLLIILISNKVKGSVILLILGVMIGYIATAIVGVLKYFSNDEDVKAYVIWGLGSFAKVSADKLPYFSGTLLMLILLSFLLAKKLNLMLLGENYARNLGLNVRQARNWIIISACSMTALTTAYCGPIMFLGLAVPHLCRILFATSDHRTLLPSVALCGSALALFCNLIARMPGFEGALPINSVTALIGAPIAISILLKKRRGDLSV